MHLDRDSQFDRFAFRPWMGYVAAAVLLVVAWDRDAVEWIIVRALALTCFFATGYLSHRRRNERGGGTSVGGLKSLVFAILCALVMLSFLIAYLLDKWVEWVG